MSIRSFQIFKFVSLALVLATSASAQYVATATAGVPYPSLTSPSPVILAAAASLDPSDRGRATILLGFVFPFYTKVYSTVTVTANGVAFFEPSSAANINADFSANTMLPSSAEPNGVVAPLWDDLWGNNPTSELRKQSISGVNGQGLAVEWKDWNRFGGTYSLTFQIRFWSNGIVEFFYGSMTGGGTPLTATIGIENSTGGLSTVGLTSCNSACAITSFDPMATGTPISSIVFGPPAGSDIQSTGLTVNSINATAGVLSIDATMALRNFGSLATGAFTYAMYLSQDTAFQSQFDLPLNPNVQGPFVLNGLESASDGTTFTVPVPDAGSWYVLGVLDNTNAVMETNENNNLVASSVPYAAGVDLVAQRISPPAVTGPGEPISVSVSFANRGFTPAGSVNVKILLSLDNVVSIDDRLIHERTINVPGGQEVNQNVNFTMPSGVRADNYYLMLKLDDGPDAGQIAELSETNNTVFSTSTLQVKQADLVITEVRVKESTIPFADTQTIYFGERVQLEAYVSNIGGSNAPNVRVAFYLSDNETLNALNDNFIGEVINLSVNSQSSQWVTLPNALVPTQNRAMMPLTSKAYFIFASAIGVGLVETDATNNFLKAPPVLGRPSAPNLAPFSIQSPNKLGAGEIVAVSRTLTNLGNRPSPSAKYSYVLSANTIITADDTILPIVENGIEKTTGSVTLGIGQQDAKVELIRIPADVPAANMYLGVLMDPQDEISETNENDNGLPSPVVQVIALSLGLANTALPDAFVGAPYDIQLVSRGGVAPFVFGVEDISTLPPGLTLSASGKLSGSPTQYGAYPVMFTVKSQQLTARALRVIRVATPTVSLQLTANALPAPVRGVPYDFNLGATGGLQPYRFSLAMGTLPQGLILQPNGSMTGITTQALGTSVNVAIRVIDALNNADVKVFNITIVDAAAFAIKTTVLPEAALGKDYLATLVSANGGGAPVSMPVLWRVISGTLPNGIVLEASTNDRLILSGTPSRPGRYVFQIEAVDAKGRNDVVSYVLSVEGSSITLSGDIPASLNPGAKINTPLSVSQRFDGARFFIRDGQLPVGISIDEAGLISGEIEAEPIERPYVFTVAYGFSRSEVLTLKSFGTRVEKVTPLSKKGCSVGGTESLILAALLLAAKRRTRL
jgi:hypothetical protein